MTKLEYANHDDFFLLLFHLSRPVLDSVLWWFWTKENDLRSRVLRDSQVKYKIIIYM